MKRQILLLLFLVSSTQWSLSSASADCIPNPYVQTPLTPYQEKQCRIAETRDECCDSHMCKEDKYGDYDCGEFCCYKFVWNGSDTSTLIFLIIFCGCGCGCCFGAYKVCQMMCCPEDPYEKARRDDERRVMRARRKAEITKCCKDFFTPAPKQEPLLQNNPAPPPKQAPVTGWGPQPTAPPPQTMGGPGKYTVTVLAAMDLPNADGLGGKSDPYCSVFQGGTKLFSTPSRSGTLNPSWGTTQTISWDGFNDLMFSIYDSDLFTKDDWLAQYILKKDDIPRGVSGTFPLQIAPKFVGKPGAPPTITISVSQGGGGWFS